MSVTLIWHEHSPSDKSMPPEVRALRIDSPCLATLRNLLEEVLR